MKSMNLQRSFLGQLLPSSSSSSSYLKCRPFPNKTFGFYNESRDFKLNDVELEKRKETLLLLKLVLF